MGVYVAVQEGDLITVHAQGRNGPVVADGMGIKVKSGNVSWDTAEPNTLTISNATSPKEERGAVVFPERSSFGI